MVDEVISVLKKAVFSDQTGQAMVELALIVPLICLLILAIVDFGRIYSTQLVLNHAVRSGARAAAVLDITTYNTNTLIKNQIGSVVNNDAQFISVDTVHNLTVTGLPWSTGTNITVDATYSVPLTAPIVTQIYGGSFQLESQVTMSRE